MALPLQVGCGRLRCVWEGLRGQQAAKLATAVLDPEESIRKAEVGTACKFRAEPDELKRGQKRKASIRRGYET